MDIQPTVRVEPVDGSLNAYRLIWEERVHEADVPAAFHALTAILDKAAAPVHVLVDLSRNPNIPLAATTQETLSGPFRHPRMGEWLVVGTNWRAKMVADVITKVGLRTNIHWFDAEADALAFLERLSRGSESP